MSEFNYQFQMPPTIEHLSLKAKEARTNFNELGENQQALVLFAGGMGAVGVLTLGINIDVPYGQYEYGLLRLQNSRYHQYQLEKKGDGSKTAISRDNKAIATMQAKGTPYNIDSSVYMGATVGGGALSTLLAWGGISLFNKARKSISSNKSKATDVINELEKIFQKSPDIE